VERYGVEMPAWLRKHNVIEVNRLASEDNSAMLMLLREEFLTLRGRGVEYVVTTTPDVHLRDQYMELGMQRTAVQFRYRDTDPQPAHLLVAPLATLELTRLWDVTERLTARQVRRSAA
jgi:hypothetical protein